MRSGRGREGDQNGVEMVLVCGLIGERNVVTSLVMGRNCSAGGEYRPLLHAFITKEISEVIGITTRYHRTLFTSWIYYWRRARASVHRQPGSTNKSIHMRWAVVRSLGARRSKQNAELHMPMC